MIAISIILGAVLFAVAFFWKDIVEWIKKAVDKIRQVFGVVVDGVKTFLIRTREGLKERAKYYNKNKMTKEWEEKITTKDIDENDVPADILAKVKKAEIGVEVSTTEELKLVLNN